MKIRIFKDPAKYEELVRMLNDPEYSYCAIARYFTCDRTTVMYHARKNGIYVGDRIFIKPQPVTEVKVFIDPRHPILQEERVNEGKVSYMEYVQETRDRETKRIFIGPFVF